MVERLPKLREATSVGNDLAIELQIPRVAISIPWFLYHSSKPTRSKDFFEVLLNGPRTDKEDPRNMLYVKIDREVKRYLSFKGTGRKAYLEAPEIMLWIHEAWMYWEAGKTGAIGNKPRRAMVEQSLYDLTQAVHG